MRDRKIEFGRDCAEPHNDAFSCPGHIALPMPASLMSLVFWIDRRLVKQLAGVFLLIISLSTFAAESSAPTDYDSAGEKPVATSRGLLADFERFLRQREIDANSLNADAMVRLMIDWFRFTPIDPVEGTLPTDALVYRYSGWSEGCATAFKLSLLRRVAVRNAMNGATDQLAGITLMFEPSGQAELMPFTTASSDWKSIDAFLDAIESSPAFRSLGTATPMAVVVESGGLR